MSVMMGLRIEVDVDKFKEMAAANGETLEAVSARGREKGCLHHAFYANADGGEILVVDEWSDKESFLDFFRSTPEIPQMFADAGVQVEPHPVFWERVDSGARRQPETGAAEPIDDTRNSPLRQRAPPGFGRPNRPTLTATRPYMGRHTRHRRGPAVWRRPLGHVGRSGVASAV
jgi:quinol monooxygenase YgiN